MSHVSRVMYHVWQDVSLFYADPEHRVQSELVEAREATFHLVEASFHSWWVVSCFMCHVLYNVSCVMFSVLCVTCHASRVMCHVSCLMCHVSCAVSGG